jgi:carbamate kinase
MPRARPRKRETIVIALGGNTLLSAKEKFSIHEEVENVEESCREIARIVRKGYRVVLTHGNGPQVGDILLQQEAARKVAPPMPLDVCGAQSQGEIGYLLQRSMKNVIPGISVVSLVTQTIVDTRDSAFRKPTKFIGPFYKESGPGRKKDSDRGFRRVVASPDPKEIVETQEIRRLVDSKTLVIAAGGGGVPVVIRRNRLEGVEAVIDKDLAAERLASSLQASTLMMLTDVDEVCLDYASPKEKGLRSMSLREARKYLKEGEFPPGSMGPKIEAAIRFLTHGGKKVIITSPGKAVKALEGKAGTTIKG